MCFPSGNNGRGPILFPAEAFEAPGLQRSISRSKLYNGVAILSQLPPEDVKLALARLLQGDWGRRDPLK